MSRIAFEFTKLGNARFVAFLKTMLNQVLNTLHFSTGLKAKATELKTEVELLDSIATSSTINRAELAQAQRRKVTDDVKDLIHLIESEVRNLPEMTAEEKLALIHGLELKTRKQSRPGFRTLKAKAGTKVGSVMLTTQGNADFYDWWYSKDTVNFSNPVELETTALSRTEVVGLERGLYAFFARAHRKNEAPVVEGPLVFAVI
jgi:hypothetical protein